MKIEGIFMVVCNLTDDTNNSSVNLAIISHNTAAVGPYIGFVSIMKATRRLSHAHMGPFVAVYRVTVLVCRFVCKLADNNVARKVVTITRQGPLLLTWFNLNPSMDK